MKESRIGQSQRRRRQKPGGGCVTELLRVAEIFTSIQGEGPNAGMPAIFLRTAGCNFNCSWTVKGKTQHCDTDWARGRAACTLIDPEHIVMRHFRFRSVYPLLVITGGEPTLQHKGIKEVINITERFCPNIHYIDIETNGTIPNGLTDEALIDWIGMFSNYVVSPKPQTPTKNLIRLLLCAFKTNIYLKFVHDGYNMDWIIQVFDKISEEVRIPPDNIILMSAGTSYKELHKLDKETVEICKKLGWRFSPRLHSYIWGLTRGK